MNVKDKKKSIENALAYLPEHLRDEIKYVSLSYKGGIGSISEIHLRATGVSALKIGVRTVLIKTRLTSADISEIVDRISDFSPYTHRDSVRHGYISIGGGVRVGVCGSARRADGKTLVTDISSLCIRIPTGKCDFKEDLYRLYDSLDGSFLIYSAPGGGKTTALRALAMKLGIGEMPHTVVIDERREFDRSEFQNTRIDILDGYTKREALAIAVRSMAAEVILIDELTDELTPQLIDCMHCGVKIVATIHAKSARELLSQKSTQELLKSGIFTHVIGIYRENGIHKIRPEKLSEAMVNA